MLLRDRKRLVDWNGALRDSICERRTFDQFEDERHPAIPFFQPVDRADIRMIERRQRLRFPLEARQSIRIRCEQFRQNLQRNITLQLRVERAINFAHSTRAK